MAMAAGVHAKMRLRDGRRATVRPAGRRLPDTYHKRLVLVVTGLLRRGDPPSPFAREGLLIAVVRSAIILGGGWTWRGMMGQFRGWRQSR